MTAEVRGLSMIVPGTPRPMDANKLGQAGLVGWRRKVGERIAEPVSRHTRLTFDQAMAAVGAAYLFLTVRHLFRMARAAREARDWAALEARS
jgi:hypothetical protein